MANDAYIDDSYLQAQIEQEEQEYLLWVEEQQYLFWVEEQKREEVNKQLWSLYHEYI